MRKVSEGGERNNGGKKFAVVSVIVFGGDVGRVFERGDGIVDAAGELSEEITAVADER